MKTDFKETPRVFEVKGHMVKDMGRIRLDPDELVTFMTESARLVHPRASRLLGCAGARNDY